MTTIPEAKKKGTVLCLMPIEFPSQQGDVYAYMLLDVFSDYAIHLGFAKSNSIYDLLPHIKRMFKNKDFKKIKQPNFYLVLHKYEAFRKEIEGIIQAHGGVLLVDDYYVAVKMKPLMEQLYKNLGGMGLN